MLTFAIRFHFLQRLEHARRRRRRRGPDRGYVCPTLSSGEIINFHYDMTEMSDFLGGMKFLRARVQLVLFLKAHAGNYDPGSDQRKRKEKKKFPALCARVTFRR